MFKKPHEIQDELEGLQEHLEVAQKYTQEIFDYVSMIGQVPMLQHNYDYIEAIKKAMTRLETQKEQSEEYYRDEY